MPFNPTEKQKQAIESTGSVLVSAAAGSGKTAVLVERVIAKVLDPVHPVDIHRLLVVTFTNAAAAEMKERIRLRLAQEYEKDPDNLRLLRQQMLLSKSNIATIDSFCKTLITEHFDALSLPPDFTMISAGALTALKNQALEETLNFFLENRKEETAGLAAVLGAEQATLRLGEAIQTIYEYMRSLPFPEQWAEGVKQQYHTAEEIDSSCAGQTLLHRAGSILDYALLCLDAVMAEAQIDPVLWEKRGPRLQEIRQQVTTAKQAVETGVWDTAKEACDQIDRFTWGNAKLPGGYDSPLKEITNSMQTLLERTGQQLHKLLSVDAAGYREECTALAPHIDVLLDAVAEYSRRLEEKKQQRNALDFSDVEYAALQLLITLENGIPRPTPLAAKLCESFDCVMVDEFQDVNDLQSEIFKALSNGGKNLFAVGDLKQSIYRFRKANPNNFLRLLESYPDYKQGVSPGKIILDGNFRSRPAICQGVNDVFSLLMSKEAGELIYDETHRLNPLGQFPNSEYSGISMHFLQADDQRTAIELEADAIAAMIADAMVTPCVTAGDTLRPARPGDCVILLRSMKNKAAEYCKRLRAHGLPVTAEQTDGFLDRPEIAWTLSFLRTLDNPTDDISLLSLMLSPYFGFTADQAAAIRGRQKKESLYRCVQKAARQGHQKAGRLCSDLEDLRILAATLPPTQLLQRLYERYGIVSAVQVMENGSNRKQNLLTLLSLMQEWYDAGYTRLDSLLRLVRSLEKEEAPLAPPADTAGDVIRIMSIHHAKGLQFPLCFVANGSHEFNRNDTIAPLLADETLGIGITRTNDARRQRTQTCLHTAIGAKSKQAALSEELRVLYVAMTRAVDRLVLLTTDKALLTAASRRGAALAGAVCREGYLHPERILSAASYGHMLLDFALLHPAGAPLREACAPHLLPLPRLTSQMTVTLQRADSISPPKPADKPKVFTPPRPDEAIVEELTRRLDYQNPYQELQAVFSKRSVSQLVHGEETAAPRFDRPGFLQAGGLTPAEKGTALHAFMQYARYEAAANDCEKELQRLVKEQFLTPRQGKAIDMKKLRQFFSSPLYARMAASSRLLREHRFMAQWPVTRLDSSLPPSLADETVVVQGIADCLFEEKDGIVIVDYKTDRITEPAELAAQYGNQLRCYAAILQEEGKQVKELLLYSFCLGAEIAVPLQEEGAILG